MSSLLRRPARTTSATPHPAADDSTRSVEILGDTARHALRNLIALDPIVNAVIDSRVELVGSLSPRHLGGTVLGTYDERELAGAVFHGGNLLPIGGDLVDWTALGRHLASEARICSSIVGSADAVATLWRELDGSWGVPRTTRERQPLLTLSDAGALDDADPNVRLVLPAEIDTYLPAAAAMFTEELGVSPYRCAQSGDDYRRRIAGLIRGRRALARFDEHGEVIFKADVGAVSHDTCQVQGVWVRPDLRGHGIGRRGLSAVFRYALTLSPTVSLYVNDFNTPARRMYDRLGMTEVGTLATILF